MDEMEKLIRDFMTKTIDAAHFQDSYISKYRNARDASIAKPMGDWTKGGFYSTIFCLADMYSDTPRYGGELDAAGLYEAIAKEVSSYDSGLS